jgi:hypothetical protein
MITKTANPVEWGILMYELDDAKEHLENLIAEITEADKPDEIDFGIQLEHIYSHLNRAWNCRNHIGDWSDDDFKRFSELPTDLPSIQT